MVFNAQECVCVSKEMCNVGGFWDGTIEKVPRYQTTRRVEITRGICANGRRETLLGCFATKRTGIYCRKADMIPIISFIDA